MTEVLDDGNERRRDPPSIHRLLTRHNGLVFCGLTAASFLETAIAPHAAALLRVFETDAEVRRWIEQRWWPIKDAHGREARGYIEALWPEFDWSGAYVQFYESYRRVVGVGRDASSALQTSLAYGVAAAQASAFYRALGTAADDPELRAVLYRMSADETAHFAAFRRLFARLERTKRLGLLETYRTIVACVKRARDVDVCLAYSHLGTPHWYGTVPFPQIEYGEFVRRMGDVVRRHLSPGPAQRLLFRPWWQAGSHAPSLPPRPVVRTRSVPGRRLPTRAAP